MDRFRKIVARGRRWVLCAGVLMILAGGPGVAQQTSQPPRQQDEFVPIDKLPSQDEIPAAPLVAVAYAAAWLVIFGYLWSIWRRLAAVEREIATVMGRVSRGGTARTPSAETGAPPVRRPPS